MRSTSIFALQRLPIVEFELNQERANKNEILESGLTFLAPVSLEDPVDPDVAKAVRSMVCSSM